MQSTIFTIITIQLVFMGKSSGAIKSILVSFIEVAYNKGENISIIYPQLVGEIYQSLIPEKIHQKTAYRVGLKTYLEFSLRQHLVILLKI